MTYNYRRGAADLEQEVADLQEMVDRIDELIFQEDEITRLHFDFERLARKHPDLSDCVTHMDYALSFYHRMSSALLEATKKLNEAVARREDQDK